MAISQTIAEKVEQLSPERQQQALEYVQSLTIESRKPTARKSPFGALQGQIPTLSLEDFQEARREMSANFPRELPE